jgi:catechol 2,3-dioxygenase-like lactoylglutathione lyase family enzyme
MADSRLTRRRLLQALGASAVAASFGATVFGQGRCRDGYGTQGCPLTKDLATSPIAPVFPSTGWKTVALDHILFSAADIRKEAAFYAAVMGWTLRSESDKQIVMDIGDWGSAIFRQAAPGAFDAPPNPNAGGGRGRGGRGAPVTTAVESFCFVIDKWNRANVEKEVRARGLDPVFDDGSARLSADGSARLSAERGDRFESFHVKDPDGWDLQIANGNGLAKARKTPSAAKLSEPLPFEATGWKTVWLDHFSFGATDYKKSVSFYTNLLGWKETYDEGSQNELMMGDVGDIIIRGGNSKDPNFGQNGTARERRIDHISFGISPWDTDGVRAELEKRGLVVTVDTSSAHPGPDGKMVPDDIHTAPFRSYHTRTPNGYNLQISWMNRERRLNLANAVKPK